MQTPKKIIGNLIGNKTENQAAKFLKSQGYLILNKNFVTPYGEIDIIAKHQKLKLLIFVEVKYRANNDFGEGFESINQSKLTKIHKSCDYFLQNNQEYLEQYVMRIDAISLDKNYNIYWIENIYEINNV